MIMLLTWVWALSAGKGGVDSSGATLLALSGAGPETRGKYLCYWYHQHQVWHIVRPGRGG